MNGIFAPVVREPHQFQVERRRSVVVEQLVAHPAKIETKRNSGQYDKTYRRNKNHQQFAPVRSRAGFFLGVSTGDGAGYTSRFTVALQPLQIGAQVGGVLVTYLPILL